VFVDASVVVTGVLNSSPRVETSRRSWQSPAAVESRNSLVRDPSVVLRHSSAQNEAAVTPGGDQRVQHGDPSIAHLRHVDAADRGRLLRHSQVEGQMAQIAADCGSAPRR
jgi:hypothetical protein